MDRKDLFMEAKQLQEVLAKHLLWLDEKPGGKRADFRGPFREYLRGVDLNGAILRRANFSGTYLTSADLRYADLSEADLTNTHLVVANLSRADLRGANLQGADLTLTDLQGTNLSRADLRGANLRFTNLANARLTDTIGLPQMVCPITGAFIGFKKALHTDSTNDDVIVTLEIPADAKRSSATSNRCRCSKAKVLSIEKCDGTNVDVAISTLDNDFIYRVGETVEVSNFDENRWNECAPGIHFYMTRQEAADFHFNRY